MSEAPNPRLTLHPDHGFLASLVAPDATVMVGGFGEPGTPFYLLDGLEAAGAGELTVVKNDANEPGVGVGRLLRAGLLAHLVTTHIGLNPEMMAAMDRGEVRVDFHPQGILAERIRCGGAGLPAFLSDIGLGLLPERDERGGLLRERLAWRGREYFVEPALRADVALVRAHEADRWGNLRYRKGARNFNPLMALAADVVVAEVETLRDEPLEPDGVHTPAAFVDHLVVVPAGFEDGSRASALRRARP